MRLAARYSTGLAMVAAAGVGLVLALPAAERAEVGGGVVVGLLLQAPLGWWALRSLGTDRFMLVWGLGMLLRLMAVGVTGVVVPPLLGWGAGPVLSAMVGVLVALLLVEAATAVREYSREDER